MIRRSIALLVALALTAGCLLSKQASAETVITFEMADDGSTQYDVQLTSGIFSTIDDGNAGTPGDQGTNIAYTGFLSGLTDIPSGASLTLRGVTADGVATIDGFVGDGQTVGILVSQSTSGGGFDLYDDSNVLLLSGSLTTGVITGSSLDPVGSFFSTGVVTFNDGTLLPLLLPNSGELSLMLTDVLSGATPGMLIDEATKQLANFNAVASGRLEASAVPEPSVIGMAAIGTFVLVRQRRRRAKPTKAKVA